AHGQNMRCAGAFYPTHWHGVPRIFLTAPLSYAAETYTMPKVSSFRATENSRSVHTIEHRIRTISDYLRRHDMGNAPCAAPVSQSLAGSLCPPLFDMPVAQRIRPVPVHAHQNDVLGKMGALAADHLCSPSLVSSQL